ncbi:MAG: molybdopterin cofactor-binding domain-containing protein [Sphingomicrobium sp.]
MSDPRALRLDRRTLMIGGGVGVGLVVAFLAWPHHLASDLAVRPGEQTFGNFIRIARDGRITVAVPQVETGQGIWTALPQIVADELGAAWETIGVEPAPLTKAYANPLARDAGWLEGFGTLRAHEIRGDGRMRITAGATSVRAFEQPLREAAAVARNMLVGAAADRWNVTPAECETGDGFVINGGRTFTFGELAEEAAGRNPSSRRQLRQTPKGRLMGEPLQRLDGPGKTDGSLRFAGDVRLSGMLFAAARMAPPGGRLTGFAREALAHAPGVRNVTARDGWIAVVADSWWAAEHALKGAAPTFSGTRTPADLRPLFDDAIANGDGYEWFSRGDYNGTVRGSRRLAATYYAAPSMHLGLEPVTATANVSGGAVEVWAPTQAPGFASAAIGDGALYPMPVGEPGGRALEADAIPIAIALARQLKLPVQVTLSQSENQKHDRVAPGALARMTALPGQGGITAAWQMRIVTADGLAAALARLAGAQAIEQPGRTGLDAAVPPYAIPHVRVEAVAACLPFATGYMRGSPQRAMTFFTESFIDELARAAGMEPLAFRMSLLGGNGRLARCLQGAARLAQWDGGGPGSTMGIAGCSAFGSHIGLVATASIGDDQRIRVHRLVAAVDCGRIINAGLARQQIESALIWGLAQATAAQPEWVAGTPRARRLSAVGLPRIAESPEIFVELVPNSDPPGGINGLGTTVLAPAVANAIFSGTGKRLRSLPFDATAAA